MPTKIYATGRTSTITELEYHHNSPSKEYLSVPGGFVSAHAALYAREDQSHASLRGSLYYHAPTPVPRAINVSLEGMLSTISRHFLGVDYTSFQYSRTLYTGLPFWSLLYWGKASHPFPPSAIPALAADFCNVTSDGEDEAYREAMVTDGNAKLAVQYNDLRMLVLDAAHTGGTFYYGY